MDDLTITRLCARAAGLEVVKVDDPSDTLTRVVDSQDPRGGWYFYRPLEDRAQALELVERLDMRLHRDTQCYGVVWNAAAPIDDRPLPEYAAGSSPSILRAICLCAARVQQERENQK